MCLPTENWVIQQGEAGILRGRMITTWIDDIDPLIEFYMGQNETIVWKIPDETYWYTHEKTTQNAEISEKFVIIHELQNGFITATKQNKSTEVIGIPEEAISLENEAFMVILNEKTKPAKRSVTPRKPIKAPTTPKPRTPKRINELAEKIKINKTNMVATTERPNTKKGIDDKTHTFRQSEQTTALRNDFKSIPTKQTPTTTKLIILTTPETIRSTTTTPLTPTQPTTTKLVILTTPETIRSTTMTSTPPTQYNTTKQSITGLRVKTMPQQQSTTHYLTTTKPPTTITSEYSRENIEEAKEKNTVTVQRIFKHEMQMSTNYQGKIFYIIPNEEAQSKVQSNSTQLILDTENYKTDNPIKVANILSEISEILNNQSEVVKRNVVQSEDTHNHDNYNMNAKLNYITFHQHQENAKLFYSICNQYNNQLAMVKTLVLFDATKGMRLLFRRDDLVAKKESENAIRIGLCTQIRADEVHHNYKLRETCYENMPISVNDKNLFVREGTRELDTFSKEIACENRKWTPINNASENNFDEKKEFFNFLNMANPPIFTSKSIYQSEIGRIEKALKNVKGRLNKAELQMINEIEVTNSSEAINKLFSEIEKNAVKLANKSIITIDEVVNRTVNIVEESTSFIGNIRTIVIWIGAIAICIIIITILIYLKPYLSIGLWCAQSAVSCLRPKQRKKLTVAAIEAPGNAKAEEQEAYVLSYIPKVCCITRKNHRPHISAEINGHQIRALLDTGSDITYCPYKIAKRIKLQINYNDIPIAYGIGKTPVSFIGSAYTTIRIG